MHSECVRRCGIAIVLCLLSALMQMEGCSHSGMLWRPEQLTRATACAFSHSGVILAVSCEKGVMLWDLQEHQFLDSFEFASHTFQQIAFTPDDSEIVLLSGCNDYHDPAANLGRSGTPGCFEFRLDLSRRSFSWVPAASLDDGTWALSPDGLSIATVSNSGLLCLKDAKTYRELHSEQLPSRPGGARSMNIQFSDDARSLVVQFGGKVGTYDPKTLALRKVFLDGHSHSLSFPTPLIGEGFCSHFTPRVVYRLLDGEPAPLQPAKLTVVHDGKAFPTDALHAVLLGKENYLISRYELETLSTPIDGGGTREGSDTLIVSTILHPDGEWGVILDAGMGIVAVMPGEVPKLLLREGARFAILDLASRKLHD